MNCILLINFCRQYRCIDTKIQKLFYSFLFILVISMSCNDLADQKFSVYNFNAVPETTDDNIKGIKLNFEIGAAKNIENTCYVQFQLVDSMQNVVYLSDSVYILQPQWELKQTEEKQIFAFEHFIPFNEVNLPQGNYSLLFRAIVKDEITDFGPTTGTPVQISVPQFFNYENQQFTLQLKNLTPLSDELLVNMQFSLQFLYPQIKNSVSNKAYRFYYLDFELRDFISNKLLNSDTSVTSMYELKASDSVQYLVTAIPLYHFNKPKGKHKVKIAAVVYDYKHEKQIAQLFNEVIEVDIPQFYKIDFDVLFLEADKSKLFDFSLAFGNSMFKNKKEKGYPDLFYRVNAFNEILYESEIITNSYTGPTGINSFYTINNKELMFTVYDFDLLKQNEVLGTFPIPFTSDEFVYTPDTLIQKNIKTLIKVKKEKCN